jgi:hypothetical protein
VSVELSTVNLRGNVKSNDQTEWQYVSCQCASCTCENEESNQRHGM